MLKERGIQEGRLMLGWKDRLKIIENLKDDCVIEITLRRMMPRFNPQTLKDRLKGVVCLGPLEKIQVTVGRLRGLVEKGIKGEKLSESDELILTAGINWFEANYGKSFLD